MNKQITIPTAIGILIIFLFVGVVGVSYIYENFLNWDGIIRIYSDSSFSRGPCPLFHHPPTGRIERIVTFDIIGVRTCQNVITDLYFNIWAFLKMMFLALFTGNIWIFFKSEKRRWVIIKKISGLIFIFIILFFLSIPFQLSLLT